MSEHYKQVFAKRCVSSDVGSAQQLTTHRQISWSPDILLYLLSTSVAVVSQGLFLPTPSMSFVGFTVTIDCTNSL